MNFCLVRAFSFCLYLNFAFYVSENDFSHIAKTIKMYNFITRDLKDVELQYHLIHHVGVRIIEKSHAYKELMWKTT